MAQTRNADSPPGSEKYAVQTYAPVAWSDMDYVIRTVHDTAPVDVLFLLSRQHDGSTPSSHAYVLGPLGQTRLPPDAEEGTAAPLNALLGKPTSGGPTDSVKTIEASVPFFRLPPAEMRDLVSRLQGISFHPTGISRRFDSVHLHPTYFSPDYLQR